MRRPFFVKDLTLKPKSVLNMFIILIILAMDSILLNQLHKHFIDAVKKGEFELVQYMVENVPKLDVNFVGPNGKTPLIWAIYKGHTEIALYLLNHPKINYNFVDLQLNTALIWATVKGDFDVVQALLLKSDIDINAQDDSGKTALIHAIIFGFKNIVEALLRKSGIQTTTKDFNGHDAKWYATKKMENLAALL